eukprot:3190-Heterococcus_DN1.PRE.2
MAEVVDTVVQAEVKYALCRQHIDAVSLKQCFERLHPEIKTQEVSLLLREYIRFMALKLLKNDTGSNPGLSPPKAVDDVWHTHVLDLPAYELFCHKVNNGKMIYHKLVAMLDSPVEKQQRLADACSVYHTAFSAPAMWSSSSASVTGAALSRKRKFDASSAGGSSSSSRVHAVPTAKRQAVPNTSSTAATAGFSSRVMRAIRSLIWAVLPAREAVPTAAVSVSVVNSSTQTCEEDFSVNSGSDQPVLTHSSGAAVPAATVTPVKDTTAAAAAASSGSVAAAAAAAAVAAAAASTDQAVSFTDASVPAADKVHIVVTGYAYDRTLHYSLKRTARLERLFLDYSVKAQKEIDTLRFLLDDRRLSPDDTADALGLENGDEVCVFLEQVGC